MQLRFATYALFAFLFSATMLAAVGPFTAPALNEFLLDLNQKRAVRRLAPLQAPTPAQAVALEQLLGRLQAQQGNPQVTDAELHALFPNAGHWAWLVRSFSSAPKTSDLTALLSPTKSTAAGVDWFNADFTHAA